MQYNIRHVCDDVPVPTALLIETAHSTLFYMHDNGGRECIERWLFGRKMVEGEEGR